MTYLDAHIEKMRTFNSQDINYNKLQIDGKITEVMNLTPLARRLEAFGWSVAEIDGHSMEEITEALRTSSNNKGKPSVIIRRTLMGKGVPFMEDKAMWHGMCPSDSQSETALEAIGTSDFYDDFVIEREGSS